MRVVDPRPNVELRLDGTGREIVVLSFPYDVRIVEAARRIPGRRFDWDTREWWAPADDWVGAHVADIVARFPELEPSAEAAEWLRGLDSRWIGTVATTRHDGHGWFVLRTRAGRLPEAIAAHGEPDGDGLFRAPLIPEVGAAILAERAARPDGAAVRCLNALEHGLDLPPTRLVVTRDVDGARLGLDVLWDHDAGAAFERLPGAEAGRRLPLDPWVIEPLDAFLGLHGTVVDGPAQPVLAKLRAEHDAAAEQIRRSRATSGEPLDLRLGGTLEPFQWAGVRYALQARRCFIADEQGLGKTVEALAAIEADGAFPAIVVCPASLKLTWEREAKHWLPHRSVTLVQGKSGVPAAADITILNYEIVAARREALMRRAPRALVLDESHLAKNPRAKRTQAVRRLAAALPDGALRLALTGTPVLNHAEELISQLRVLGRLEDFGSGARFAQQFQGPLLEERLHWHLRRTCFVRRLKREVLPQLPAKRQVVVPVALDNETEYRLAEEDVIAWLREQPLDLSELDAKIARVLRAERLAQLTTLQRLAARGKLHAALAWIHDFLASGEPLVVFARHVEVQEAVLERFPAAAHLLGRDAVPEREGTVQAFQADDGPQLLVAATRVAAQGFTLTRASNVAFLELEWTPAMHDQAEDRLHRIGQRDAVTAWYLLAAGTIDESMAELVARKRGIVGAVTDGRRLDGDTIADELVRDLRARPYRHLRAAG
jgi:superfamily II DNA or RNA helicase